MKRVVIGESVTRDDLARVGWDKNWSIADLIERDEKTPLQVIYSTNKGQTYIRYIEDYYIDMAYLEVTGDFIDEAVNDLQTSLPTLNKSDIIKAIKSATTEGDVMQHILYLGLIAHNDPVDQELIYIFQTLASCEIEDIDKVRSCALVAIGYSGKIELMPIVKKAASEDTSEAIRNQASYMLEGFEKYLLSENQNK